MAGLPGTLLEVAVHNEHRRAQGRLVSGLLYCCLLVGVVALAVHAAVLVGHFIVPFSSFVIRRRCRVLSGSTVVRWNTVMWVTLFVMLLLVWSVSHGIFGFLGVGLVFGLMSCCLMGFISIRRMYGATVLPDSTSVPLDEDEDAQGDGDVQKDHWRIKAWKPFRRFPAPLGPMQASVLWVAFCVAVVCLVVGLGVYHAWRVEDYVLWSHADNSARVEIVSKGTSKGLMLLYGWSHFVTSARLQWLASFSTSMCGVAYGRPLPPEERERAILETFIQPFGINMDEFDPPDFNAYSTVNEWFTRPLRAGMRPIAADGAVVSPCDSRLLIFPDINVARKVWVKGGWFSLSTLLGGRAELAKQFDGGTLVAVRLAPQDYHRFHAPLAGDVSDAWEVGGTLWSVNPLAVMSDNDVFYNQRRVVHFSSPEYGSMLFLAVGATCVGSIMWSIPHDNATTAELRDSKVSVSQGEELGRFLFGGSTVLLLFDRKDAIVWDSSIVQRSSVPVESYVRMGERIGRLKR